MNIVKRVTFAADFDAVFQLIVNARTGRIHHYEALARFPGAGGTLTPHDHISLAERTGVITVFDMAMVRKMIAWLGSRNQRDGASGSRSISPAGPWVRSPASPNSTPFFTTTPGCAAG